MSLITELLTRSTILLAICLLWLYLFPRTRATLKHWVISLTMCSLLLLPLFHYMLPIWDIELGLPESSTQLSEAPIIQEWMQQIHLSKQISTPTEASQTLDAEVLSPSTPAPFSPTVEINKETTFSVDWEASLLCVWLLGFLYFSGKLIWSLYQMKILASEAEEATFLHSNMERAFPSITPSILVSPLIATPMTWGIKHPIILLPQHAQSWTKSELETVLLHEYAHIHRKDYLLHLISVFVRSIYWFHPLVWVLSRRQLIEREKACDAYVLRKGVKPLDYAEHLITLTKKLKVSPTAPLLSLRMAQKSLIRKRTMAILAFKHEKYANSFRRKGMILGLAMVFLIFTASITPIIPSSSNIQTYIPKGVQKILTEKIAIEPAELPIIGSVKLEYKMALSPPISSLNNDEPPTDREDHQTFEVKPIFQTSTMIPSRSLKVDYLPTTMQEETGVIPKGKLKKHLKKNFAFIESGKAYVDSQVVEVESFYIFRQEIANIDWEEFLADLSKNEQIVEWEAAQIHNENWDKLGGSLEPLKENYHNHPAFSPYPILNITHEAAQLYCKWLTQQFKIIYGVDFPSGAYFRLPTKKEWVRAARDSSKSHYPWWGYHLKDKKGRYLANFNSMLSAESIHYNQEKGAYEVVWATTNHHDNFFLTAPVKSYPQNEKGLYNMIGNVAEMLDREGLAIGGSWKSTGFDVRVESIMEYEGSSPMVGLRPILVWP